MARCYSVLYQNPQGAFVNNKGKSIPPAEAMAKLESMSQSLGEKIDAEKDLLTGVLEGDKKKRRQNAKK